MAFAALNDGTNLYYEEQGEGEPLVLISGQRSDHFMWLPVLADFTHRLRVITFDHRGTDKSDKPTFPPYTTRSMAGDVIGLLDHLGVERSHVYGISMGGRIAQWIGIDHGERLGALALGCTTPGGNHSIKRTPEIDAIFLNEAKDPRAVRQRLELSYTPDWLDRHPELEKYFLNQPDLLPPHSAVLHLQASDGHDAWDGLPRLTAPTLVIHGSDDRLNPTANAYLLNKRIPNSELYIVQGGRHAFFVELRREASKTVRDFLTKHPL